jgi:hypothetical protein
MQHNFCFTGKTLHFDLSVSKIEKDCVNSNLNGLLLGGFEVGLKLIELTLGAEIPFLPSDPIIIK